MDNEDKRPDEEEIPLIEINIDLNDIRHTEIPDSEKMPLAGEVVPNVHIEKNYNEDVSNLPLAGAAMPLKDRRETKQPIMPLAGADILPDDEEWLPIPCEPLCGDILPENNDGVQKKSKRKFLKKKSKKSND